MENKLAIIGIDSLDPHIILKYRKELPNFSKLKDKSSTFISKSVFPVDTIPAWTSIYTGLHPGNHGVLYVFDVFDPNLGDLKKLNISHIKGKTFWDYANQESFKSIIVYPMLMYPTWNINGIMVSKSPFDKRINRNKTEIEIDVYPKVIKEKYKIPDKLESLWGGFPGIKHLKEWAELGKDIIEREKIIGMELYKKEKWDIFFIFFNLLDIMQHRLWRFFDKNDSAYPGRTPLNRQILEYYRIFDKIIGEFMEIYPDNSLIVMSDHGHRSRPIKTININRHLREKGYLSSKGKNKKIKSKIKNTTLEVANRLNIEHWLIKLIVMNQKLTTASKSIYSSAGSIDKNKSIAYLSNFAGLKSYPHGGIEINRSIISNGKYQKIRKELIESLSELKTSDGQLLMKFIKKREELYPGKFTKNIYPDIVFELENHYGVGYDVYSTFYGKAYDHNVASGGHAKEAVFLMKNIKMEVRKNDINIIDIAPTILDILGIDWHRFDFDGRSIF